MKSATRFDLTARAITEARAAALLPGKMVGKKLVRAQLRLAPRKGAAGLLPPPSRARALRGHPNRQYCHSHASACLRLYFHLQRHPQSWPTIAMEDKSAQQVNGRLYNRIHDMGGTLSATFWTGMRLVKGPCFALGPVSLGDGMQSRRNRPLRKVEPIVIPAFKASWHGH